MLFRSLAPKARPTLDVFAEKGTPPVEGGGSTWNATDVDAADRWLEVEGEGRDLADFEGEGGEVHGG